MVAEKVAHGRKVVVREVGRGERATCPWRADGGGHEVVATKRKAMRRAVGMRNTEPSCDRASARSCYKGH